MSPKTSLSIGVETVYAKHYCPFKACIHYKGCDHGDCHLKDEFNSRDLIIKKDFKEI